MVKNPGKGLRPGVYERMASGKVKPILIFIRSPSYQVRLRWFDVIRDSFFKHVQRRFSQSYERAFVAR
jgi:hypothetical protein